MEQYLRDFFVSRIKCGYVALDKILVYPPTPDVEYASNKIYIDLIEKNDGSVYSEDELLNDSIASGLWDEKREREYTEILPRDIENFKVEIYNSFFKSNTKKTVRKYLAAANARYEELNRVRSAILTYSTESIASFYKSLYTFSMSCRTLKGNKVDWSKLDLVTEMNNYHAQLINTQQAREIVRTTPWITYYEIQKKNKTKIFHNKILNIEQQVILNWSILYDNIKQCSDAPNDEIIADDDALDGWLITYNKKKISEKNRAALDDKMSKAQEMFIVAETQEDANKIISANNQQGMSVIKSRMDAIKKHGVVKDHEFSDQKQKLEMAKNQMFSEKIKGN